MKTARLSEVCKIVNGGTPKSGVSEYWGGDVAWLTPAEMGKRQTPYISQTARSISRSGLANCSARQVPIGAVVMSTRAPIGHLAIPEVPMAFNQGCRGLIPNDALDTKYLYYFLWFSRDALNELGTGATFKELSNGALGNYQIPLPSLEEQRRIVAVLDEAFGVIATAIASAEKNLASARALFPSILAESLHQVAEECETRELRSLLASGRKISYGIVKPGPHDPHGVRLIKSQQVRDNEMDLSADFRITKALDNEYVRTRLQGGEILLNLVGASIGRSAVAPDELRGANVSRAIAVIPVSADLVPWVQYNLRGSVGQELIRSKTGGSAQPVLNLAEVKALSIPLPPLPKQETTVRRLDKLSLEADLLVRTFRHKMAALGELKQSLLHSAFAGGLGVRDTVTSEPANDNFATREFAAKIVAFAYERHVAKNRVRNFGTVKAEKILHMVEAVGGIDLGRQPMRQPAGPDDAQHRHATWDWARSHAFFAFHRRSGGGHDFVKLPAYETMIADSRNAVERAGPSVLNAIELLVDMDRDFAELVATTYSAWNNLILDRRTITDDAIVRVARDEWHEDKLRFDPSRFHDAIRFIRANNFAPDGSAKRVGGQEQLSL